MLVWAQPWNKSRVEWLELIVSRTVHCISLLGSSHVSPLKCVCGKDGRRVLLTDVSRRPFTKILLPSIWSGSCMTLMELPTMPDAASVLVQVMKIYLFNFRHGRWFGELSCGFWFNAILVWISVCQSLKEHGGLTVFVYVICQVKRHWKECF